MSNTRLAPVLLLASLSLATAVNGSYTPGTTCSDNVDSQQALLGKHLIVMELAWAPFASVDSTAPKGWSGYNIELMDELATLLGFTYEILDIGYPNSEIGETWTSHAISNIDNGDVLMSFWYKNMDRMKELVFVDGHIDVSPGLIGLRSKESGTDPWSWDSITSFMLPFTWTLWGCLLLLVILSGVSDYIIERKTSTDARLSASLYEYAAGFLWGGFGACRVGLPVCSSSCLLACSYICILVCHAPAYIPCSRVLIPACTEYPLSTSSKVFQVLLAFTFLIVISTYTANLAAFITLSAGPGLSVTSMNQAMASGKALCMEEGGYNTRITANFPKMKYELLLEANSAGDRLVDQTGCEGVLAPKNFYDGWRTDAKYCNLEIVETMYPDTAGWLGSKNSLCVVRAINYGLLDLKVRGVIDRLYFKYFPVISCAAQVAAVEIDSGAEEPDVSRRRLHSSSHPSEHHSRQLKGGDRRAASEQSTDSGSLAVPQIGVEQLKGLFLTWLIITLSLITWTYTNGPIGRFISRVAPASLVRLSAKILPKREFVDADGDGLDDNSAGPDNEMAMLRNTTASLRIMHEHNREMKKVIYGLSKHVGFTPDLPENTKKWKMAKQNTIANIASSKGSVLSAMQNAPAVQHTPVETMEAP